MYKMSIRAVLGIFLILSACYPGASPNPPLSPVASPLVTSTLDLNFFETITPTTSPQPAITLAPTFTREPNISFTPAITRQPAITPTPTFNSQPAIPFASSPIPGEYPWWWDNLQGFEQLLPPGAEPSYEQIWEWVTRRSCTSAKAIIAVPYRLSDGKWNIVAIAGRNRENPESKPVIYWDWQHETIKPGYWKEIRYLAEPQGWTTLSFLSLDEAGQWWIAAINGPCEAPSLSALLPVTQPERVYFEASRIEKERRTFYWVLDDTRLTLYEWQNNTAVSLWTMDNAPGSAVTPSVRQDFTGDGKPELALTWKRNPVDKEHPVDLLQIYRMKDTNFELISELESDYHQYSDVDGDNIAEYLWPVPPEAPKTWKVYGWNGERFEWKASLTKPAIHPITPKVGFPLPICSFDLVKIQHYEGSSYSVTTSDSTITWKIPNTFTYVSGYSTFGWDPNCKYLIHARADGENGLYRIDLKTGNVKTLLSLANTRAYGAVHPIVLQNGDIVFTIQGVDATLYPPPGIYLLASSGELQLLADIDPLKDTGDRDSPVDFGSLKVLRSGEVNYQSP